MQLNEYELVKQVQNKHWWWLGREAIIETIIEKYLNLSQKLNIADVGCGFGANISMLRKYGDVTGLELNDEAIENVKKRWGNSVQTISGWKSPNSIPVKFDFMLLADVLEHIPDDKGAVDWIYEHLTNNGHVLITVPAHQYFWSQMDEVLYHHRRYSLKSLTSLFDERFEVVYCSYYNMFLFPIKVVFVLYTKLKNLMFPQKPKRSYNEVPSPFLNSLFKHILTNETSIIKRGHAPFGVSLICLARKRENNT